MAERYRAWRHAPASSQRVALSLALAALCLSLAQVAISGAADASAATATFGKTTVGASSGLFTIDRKRGIKYALPVAGAVSELSIYVAPTANSGQQLLEGILYANSSGTPGALLGVTTALTFQSTSPAGWYHLPFPSPLEVAAGEYWIGVISGASTTVAGYRYDNVAGSRDWNTNSYASGPSNPFGSFTQDSQQMSLYATYTPTAPPSVPVNSSPPSISGTAQSGQTLTASPGSWTESPSSYAYQWQRCDSLGENCAPISLATMPSYKVVDADVKSTLRVAVIASNATGSSAPATSAHTAVVTAPNAPAHVMVIVEENRNRGEVIGSSSMPYLNKLATEYGNTTEWHGVSHPSLPNYLALASGSVQGQSSDTCEPSFGGETIGSQLSKVGVGWKAYMEGLPSAGSTVCTEGSYAKKHNPFAYFPGSNGSHVVPGSQYQGDLSAGTLPPFVWYTPNLCNDGHDCGNSTVDGSLKGLLEPLLASKWYAEKGTVIVTYDEDVGEGRIATVVINQNAKGRVETASSSHYGTLATIEDLYKLPRLGNAAGATTLAPLLEPAKEETPVNSSPPSISGSAQSGQTLSANPGTWTGSPSSYAYQWQRCNSLGENCTPISLATMSSYKVVDADVKSTLRVAVIASNAAGPSAPATSAHTAVVAPAPKEEPPVNSTPPSISGSAQSGQTLSANPGTWTSSPTSYAYAWQRCDSTGASCSVIAGSTAQTYTLGAADVNSTVRVSVIATNAAGSSAPASSAQTAVVQLGSATFGKTSVGALSDHGMFANYKIVHAATLSASGSVTKLSVYAIPGISSSAQALKAVIYADSSGSPGALLASGTEVTYQAKVNGAGWFVLPFASPVPLGPATYWIGFITGSTSEGMGYVYDKVANSRAYNENAFAGGPTNPFGSSKTDTEQASLYAAYVPGTPPPLNTSPPTISGAAQQAQALTEVHGTWTNNPTSFAYQWLQCDGSGNSCKSISAATSQTYVPVAGDVGHTLKVAETATNAGGSSAPTASSATAVVVPPAPVNTSPPTISGIAEEGQTLTETHGTWTNSPTGFTYQWQQCDASGGSCTSITGASGLTYPLVASDIGHTLRVLEIASNAAGSSAPASSAATAVVIADPLPPANTSPPTISGTAQQGQTLTAAPGSWTESPTAYNYEWKRCDTAGANCAAIAGASAQSYVLGAGDLNSTLRVSVIASNAAGPSQPATSPQTAVVTGSKAVSHLTYVLENGTTYVYDMDHEYKLLKTISLPQTSAEVRGVTVAPASHLMFIPYGGDGGGNGNGSVLAYDLVSEKVIWDVKLTTGIDSGQVSPDGKRLYIPTGELDPSGIWDILDATNGALIGTIKGGSGAHNTVVSNDGRYVYLGGRNYNHLDVYETETGKVKESAPLKSSVRPLTVNGSNTLAFTTATNFDGFQVSSITTGKVLFTTSFGEVPKEFAFSSPSHGIGLSPDEKQAYVLDAVHKQVQFWDVSKVKESVAPTQIGVVAVAGIEGTESNCKYDCGRGGWLQLSLDGRFLFVGDSGEVIDTATRKVITTLPTLLNTKKSIEVDWQNGVPIATSGRTGVGMIP